MKKGLLLVVVMLATIAVKAQDIYVGGSLNVWRNSTGNTTSFKVAPEVGYNFNETWALGAELNYSHEYVKQVTANTVTYQQMHSLLLRISVGLTIKTMLCVCSWMELLLLVS